MAKAFCGDVLATKAFVACSKIVAPSALNWRATMGATWPCGMPADALVSWLPFRMTGPSRNLVWPARSHVING